MHSSVRKILGVVLALSMVLGMAACGNSTEKDPVDQSTAVLDTASEPTQEPTAAPEPSETVEESKPEPSGEATPEPVEEPKFKRPTQMRELPESEALEFVQNMKIGWNLGNSFDAMDCTWLKDDMEYETAWCGAKATEELFQAIKDAGFNTVRIPVAWHNHLSDKDKYIVNTPWLDRVNEVVDYAIDRDMYVIINIHHDNTENFLYPSKKYEDQSIAYVKAIWQQLAERFRDYDDHLLFAGMNEPRLVGHANEWWIDDNSQDCKDAIECINKLNQTFVDTVRASGGNNATRYLICPGYDASPEGALNKGFVFPTDPVESNDHRIILSVHAYTPYNFALESPGVNKWSSLNTKDVGNLIGFMDKIYDKYVKQGVPVIIDEFGSMDKKGNLEARVDHAGYFVAAARVRGMSCIWWDNNAFKGDGELFGLIDRKTCEWRFPEIPQAMMEALENIQ